MKRLQYYILLVIAIFVWNVSSNHSSSPRPVTHIEANSIPSEQQINFILAKPDCALPTQVEKIQVSFVQLTARQHLKRISETIFGHNANTITTHRIARRICRSKHILLNLETYDIGFPFSAFW